MYQSSLNAFMTKKTPRGAKLYFNITHWMPMIILQVQQPSVLPSLEKEPDPLYWTTFSVLEVKAALWTALRIHFSY